MGAGLHRRFVTVISNEERRGESRRKDEEWKLDIATRVQSLEDGREISAGTVKFFRFCKAAGRWTWAALRIIVPTVAAGLSILAFFLGRHA